MGGSRYDGPKECTTREGIPGKCRPLPDCIPVQKSRSHTKPTICSEESFFEIVCCPKISYKESYKYWKTIKGATKLPPLTTMTSDKREIFVPLPPKAPKREMFVPLPPKAPKREIFVPFPPKSEILVPLPPKREGLVPLPPKREGLVPLPPKREGLVPLPPKREGLVPLPPKREVLVPLPPKREVLVPLPPKREVLVPLPPKSPDEETPQERKVTRSFNLPSCGIAPQKKSANLQHIISRAFPRVRDPYNRRGTTYQGSYSRTSKSRYNWRKNGRLVTQGTRRFKRQTSTEGVQYIVGGRTSEDDAWPWMAAIYTVNGGQRSFICGGTIISDRHILTAAHCFKTSSRQTEIRGEYLVRVGVTDLSDFNAGFEFGVKKITLHEGFNPPSFYNDIAILEVDGHTMDVDPSAHPICLPKEHAEHDHLEFKIATLLGWGTITFAGRDSKKLNEVDVPVTTNAYCNESYAGLKHLRSYPNGITSNIICAGYRSGGKDACQGDSGGPLMMLDDSRQWTLQGIISGGFQCARPGFPGIYTRVSAYTDWIVKNMT
ncbi:Clotting factor B [Nymphon striatum]|nr:Clotting factor B [Nymphon striatum]